MNMFLLILLRLVVPILVLLIFYLREDKYKSKIEFWNKQNWSLYKIFIIIFVISIYQLFSLFLVICEIISPTFILVYFNPLAIAAIGAMSYFILNNKSDFSFSVVGLSYNRIFYNILIGIIAFTAYASFVVLLSIILNLESLVYSRADLLIKLNLINLPIGSLIYYLVGLFIIVPFVEEFIFRGVMYSPIQRKFGTSGAILITSIFWALSHQVLRSLLSIFLIGVLLCYLYEKRKSLIPGIVLHSLLNISTFLIYVYVTGLKV